MAITDKDVEKLKNVFATKDDFINTKWELMNSIDNLKQELKQEIAEKYDKILDGQGYLIKKVETALQETRVTFGQYKKQEEKLADHENRVKVLEASRS